MKYLFGDGGEFSEEYDFLETLKTFLQCAGRCTTLEHEIGLREEELAKHSADKNREMELVMEFCEGVIEDLKTRTRQAKSPETVQSQSAELIAAANKILEAAQAEFDSGSRERRAEAEAEIEEKREEIRAAVDSFLTTAELGTISSSFSMRLDDHTVGINAASQHPGGITTSFQLDPTKSSQWSSPLKVQDVLPDLSVQVGMRKKFLSKALTPEVVQLDEYTITSIDLTPSSCELHVSRKGSEDDLIFKMERVGDAFYARTSHASDDEDREAEPEDTKKLEALWDALEARSHEALPHRRRLLWVQLDGSDVLEEGLMMQFIERLVVQFAPLASEVARRSANPAELSLKVDRGDGRREEIYVRKSDLVAPLSDAPDGVRQSFAPLGIFPAGPTPSSPPTAE